MIDIKQFKLEIEKHTHIALKTLNGFRQEIENINDELYWVKNSPLPLADANVKIEEFIQTNSTKEGIEHFFYNHELGGLKPLEVNTKLDSSIRIHENFILGSGGSRRPSKYDVLIIWGKC